MDFLSEATATLTSTPEQVEALTLGLSEAQLSWRAAENSFSLRENLLHLRDIDIEAYEQRLRRILSEECPLLPDVDGGRLAIERDYNAQPIGPALEDLRRSRAASVERLKACTEANLDRKAEMQGVGVITLRRLLELWMEHDRDHLADMTELRRAIDTGEGHQRLRNIRQRSSRASRSAWTHSTPSPRSVAQGRLARASSIWFVVV